MCIILIPICTVCRAHLPDPYHGIPTPCAHSYYEDAFETYVCKDTERHVNEVERPSTCDACAKDLSKYVREGDGLPKEVRILENLVINVKHLVEGWELAEDVVRKVRDCVETGYVSSEKAEDSSRTCNKYAEKLSKYERKGDELSKVVMDFKRLVDSWEPTEDMMRRLKNGVDGGRVTRENEKEKGH